MVASLGRKKVPQRWRARLGHERNWGKVMRDRHVGLRTLAQVEKEVRTSKFTASRTGCWSPIEMAVALARTPRENLQAKNDGDEGGLNGFGLSALRRCEFDRNWTQIEGAPRYLLAGSSRLFVIHRKKIHLPHLQKYLNWSRLPLKARVLQVPDRDTRAFRGRPPAGLLTCDVKRNSEERASGARHIGEFPLIIPSSF